MRTIVEQVLKRNPNEGHLFVCVGKRREVLNILFWDQERRVVKVHYPIDINLNEASKAGKVIAALVG